MVELGATGSPAVQCRRRDHPERGREKVHPERAETARAQGGGERPGRIHARPGDRRFGEDVDGDERSNAKSRPTRMARSSHGQDHQHEQERDRHLRGEGRGDTGVRDRRSEVRRWMGERVAEHEPGESDTSGATGHLRHAVKDRVARRYPAEPPEGERDRGVQMRARPFSPGRVGQGDGRDAHRETHQGAAQRGVDGVRP